MQTGRVSRAKPNGHGFRGPLRAPCGARGQSLQKLINSLEA